MAKKDSVIKTTVEAVKPTNVVTPAPAQMSSAPTSVQANPAPAVAKKK